MNNCQSANTIFTFTLQMKCVLSARRYMYGFFHVRHSVHSRVHAVAIGTVKIPPNANTEPAYTVNEFYLISRSILPYSKFKLRRNKKKETTHSLYSANVEPSVYSVSIDLFAVQRRHTINTIKNHNKYGSIRRCCCAQNKQQKPNRKKKLNEMKQRGRVPLKLSSNNVILFLYRILGLFIVRSQYIWISAETINRIKNRYFGRLNLDTEVQL